MTRTRTGRQRKEFVFKKIDTKRFRSLLESKFYETHKDNIVGYESATYSYVTEHRYTPDFEVTEDLYLETKGLWVSSDRQKVLQAMKQNPGLKIVMIFQRPQTVIYKGSKTTYADWCDKNKVTWFDHKDDQGIKAFLYEELEATMGPTMTFEEARAETDAYYAGEQK